MRLGHGQTSLSATLALAGDVAFEHLVRSEECDFLFALAVLAEFFLSLGEGLAVHQGFGLCKEVREEFLVMVADLVVAVGRGDEVARNHFRSLVKLYVVLEADAESDGETSLDVPRPKFPEFVEGWAGSGYIARRSVRTCGTPAPLLQRHHSAAPRGHYP